jgi:hypothetical protein
MNMIRAVSRFCDDAFQADDAHWKRKSPQGAFVQRYIERRTAMVSLNNKGFYSVAVRKAGISMASSRNPETFARISRTCICEGGSFVGNPKIATLEQSL